MWNMRFPNSAAGCPVNLARTAVASSAMLSLIMTATMLTFDPPDRCPQWHLPDASGTSLWLLLVLWTVPIMAFNGFIVARWRWVERVAAERARQAVPVSYVLARMCVLGSLISQLPLFLLIFRCTELSR